MADTAEEVRAEANTLSSERIREKAAREMLFNYAALLEAQPELLARLRAAEADNRKLALHTAEQATELGKLRDQLEAAQDKALRFDIDSVDIERREAEGAELVTLRAELSAAQARIAELEAALASHASKKP